MIGLRLMLRAKLCMFGAPRKTNNYFFNLGYVPEFTGLTQPALFNAFPEIPEAEQPTLEHGTTMSLKVSHQHLRLLYQEQIT